MLVLTCVDRYKGGHGYFGCDDSPNYTWYELVDAQGNKETWESAKLKGLMESNEVSVTNLTLTKDNRIIIKHSGKNSEMKMSNDLVQWMLGDATIRNAVSEANRSTFDKGLRVFYLGGFLSQEIDSISAFFDFGGQEAIEKNKDMYNLMMSGDNYTIAKIFYDEIEKRDTLFSFCDPGVNRMELPAKYLYIVFNEYEGQYLGLDNAVEGEEKHISTWHSLNLASKSANKAVWSIASEGWNTIYLCHVDLRWVGFSYIKSNIMYVGGKRYNLDNLMYVETVGFYVVRKPGYKQFGNIRVVEFEAYEESPYASYGRK